MHRLFHVLLFLYLVIVNKQGVGSVEDRRGAFHRDQRGAEHRAIVRHKQHHQHHVLHQQHLQQDSHHQDKQGSLRRQKLQKLRSDKVHMKGERRRQPKGRRMGINGKDQRGTGRATLHLQSLSSGELQPGTPSGFFMKRRKPNQRQMLRKFSTTKTVDDIIIRFNGQCTYFRQLSPKSTQRKLTGELFRINPILKERTRLITYACIEKLIVNIFLSLYPKINYSHTFESMNQSLINISGHVFKYESWALKNSLIVDKLSPKYSHSFKISLKLLLISFCGLAMVVLASIVVAQCYFCVKDQVLRPPLFDLTRYSEDEMPKCMRGDGAIKHSRGRTKIYITPVPGLQTYRNKDGSQPKLDVYGQIGSDDCIGDVNNNWSSEIEYPRDAKEDNQEVPQIYATVNKSPKIKNIQSSTECPGKQKKEADEIVPLFQCQSLNRDYDFVAQDSDSDLDSFDEPPMDSPCVTRVTYPAGEKGQAKLETDL